MEVTFLGTGTSQGVPLIACECEVCHSADTRDKRLRSSVMFTVDGKNFVIDTGPDFRQQMLRENVKSLAAVLFTHEHKDHIAGLDDVRAFNFRSGNSVDVYASENVQTALRREFMYVFENSGYPGIPKIELKELKNEEIIIDGIKVIPLLVYHYKLPVFGFRIGDFSYITDANRIPDETAEKIKGSKVIVLNALRREKHISHFTLDEAVEVINKFNPEIAYFTHISHQLGFHEEVEKELPENIRIAYDGLKVRL